MRDRVAIERDRLRRLALILDGLAEKRFGCLHVTLCAKHEIYRLGSPINRPVKIDPSATDLQVRLVNPPRLSHRYCETVPTLDELRRIALHPTQDRRVPRGLPSGREQATTLPQPP